MNYRYRRVGFYGTRAELSGDLSAAESPLQARVLRYLSGGALVLASGQGEVDPLDPSGSSPCQVAVLTDGHWVWPAILAHYVEKYHVMLPRGFMESMSARGWRVPSLSSQELDDVCDWVISNQG